MKKYTLYGEDLNELKEAADTVDDLEDVRGKGDNAIRYQIMGDDKPQPWTANHVTDETIIDLQMGFIIVQDEEGGA